jgi:hypothetical protein
MNAPMLIKRLSMLLLAAWALKAQSVPRHAATGGHINRSTGTLVYDARLREFRCWSEGSLLPEAHQQVCQTAFGWHPVNANLYFTNGQAVNVLIMNGVAEDTFSLDVTADDLAEPTVPISRTLSELPKFRRSLRLLPCWQA